MNLRPYQREDLTKSLRDIMAGKKRNLIVWATGLGKTVLMAHIVGKIREKRALIIVNREELVWQTVDKIKASYPDISVSVEKAEHRSNPNSVVVVASVQTIGSAKNNEDGTPVFSKRLQSLDPSTFDIVMVDECHRSSADSYRNVLKYFQVYRSDSKYNDPNRILFGLTATPNRSDNKGLGEFFDNITATRDIRWGIQNGYLADIEAYRVETTVDISDVRVTAGEFNAKDLEKKINTPARNELVVKKYLEITGGKKALFFTVDIQHAEDLAAELVRQGVKASAVSSRTSDDMRRQIFEMHKSGQLTALCGATIFCLDEKTEILTSEGWRGIDSISESDHVANWWGDWSVTFEPPLEVFKRKQYPGEKILHLSSPRRDIRITEDHNMAVLKPTGIKKVSWLDRARLLKVKAKNIGFMGPVFIPACGEASPAKFNESMFSPKPIEKKRFISYTSSLLRKKGYNLEQSIAESERRYARKSKLQKKSPKELSLEECMFIGFWLGDGGKLELQHGGVEFKISQSLRNQHNISWLEKIISKIGVHSIKREKKPTRTAKRTDFDYLEWSFPRGTGGGCQERDGLYAIEDYLDKNGSNLLWGLSRDQFDALLYGLWRADGNHKKDENRGKTFHIYSINTKFLDTLQAIASVRGLQANIHPKNEKTTTGTISISSDRYFGYNTGGSKLVESDSSGERVWCVKSTSGFIITRRNGKVAVLGNCEGYDDPTIEVGCMVRPFRSGLIYRQAVGRVLRPYPAPEALSAMRANGVEPPWIKPCAIIIDYVDVSSRHSLLTVPSLFGLSPKLDAKGQRVEAMVKEMEGILDKLPEKLKNKTKLEEIEDIANLQGIVEKVDLISAPETPEEVTRASELSWIKKGDSYILNTPTKTNSIRRNTNGHYEIRSSKNGISSFIGVSDTLENAIRRVEKSLSPDDRSMANREAGWRSNPISDKQVDLLAKIDKSGLAKAGGNASAYKAILRSSMSAGQAQALISSLLSRRL